MSQKTPQQIADEQEAAQKEADEAAQKAADEEAKKKADEEQQQDQATKRRGATVRILRTVPVEGVVYRADQLVKFSGKVLASVPESAYDKGKDAVDFRKKEGAEVISHGDQVEDEE